MLRNWVAWLGTDKEREDNNSSVVNDEQKHHVNKAPANAEEDARPPQLLLKAKGLSGKLNGSSRSLYTMCWLVCSMSVKHTSLQVTFIVSPVVPQRNCPNPSSKRHKR